MKNNHEKKHKKKKKKQKRVIPESDDDDDDDPERDNLIIEAEKKRKDDSTKQKPCSSSSVQQSTKQSSSRPKKGNVENNHSYEYLLWFVDIIEQIDLTKLDLNLENLSCTGEFGLVVSGNISGTDIEENNYRFCPMCSKDKIKANELREHVKTCLANSSKIYNYKKFILYRVQFDI